MRRILTLLMLFLFVFSGDICAQTQFGKNRVVWRELDWWIYESPHFSVRTYFDPENPSQYKKLEDIIGLLENQYSYLSSSEMWNYEIGDRLPVIVFETHSDLEGSALASPFLPEGVGAFVDFSRLRMVTKEDFEPQLRDRVVAHEMVHQFQMSVIKEGSLLGRVLGLIRIPNGFIEGGAEYMAGIKLPHTRDDIRDRDMRMMGSDIHLMPSWEDLVNDRVNGYVGWRMVFDFLDAKFGSGTGVKFHVGVLRDKKDIGETIYRLSRGKLGNPNENSELFNQEFFNYYNNLYELDRSIRLRPYQETDNFKGRNITPFNHPYPMLSPVLSPDGKQIACFTVQDYSVALVIFRIPEPILYSEDIIAGELEEAEYDERTIEREDGKKVIINITDKIAPIPYEYLVNPLQTWPKNGSHIAWSKDGRIAFFARTGRDHVLYIVEAKENGEILQKVILDVDQGFSPSFSPDNRKVYFSAASHATFDIYSVDLATGHVANLTTDQRYNTAPNVSPDGTQVVYVGNDGDFNHLFLLNLMDGAKRQLTFGRYNDSAPSWSDDGTRIVFISDQKDKIWNLYTLDLASNIRLFWTDFFGGVDTPIFARASDNKVYYAIYRNDDTFHGEVYPNYEIFEAELKSPISAETVVDNGESNIYNFDPDMFLKLLLDPNQVKARRKPPEDWLFEASDVTIGANTYWGLFASSYVQFTNLMETKQHKFQFANYGSFLRVIDYTHINQENRMGKGFRVFFDKYPLYYKYYDITQGKPKSDIINIASWREQGVGAVSWYPFSKWTRIEFSSSLRDLNFGLGNLTPEAVHEFEYVSDNDKQLVNLMSESNGTSIVSGISLVRDTVIGSPFVYPSHGNAFRIDFNFAPSLGDSFNGYTSVSAEARIYRRLSAGSLLALRGDVKSTTRKSGEIIVAGGHDKFRGEAWGSIVGNQLLYGSAEIRFPLLDGIVFPGGFGIGPFRGLGFVDGGVAKFSGEDFPAQKVGTFGFGLELQPFQLLWTGKKLIPSFYITAGW